MVKECYVHARVRVNIGHFVILFAQFWNYISYFKIPSLLSPPPSPFHLSLSVPH